MRRSTAATKRRVRVALAGLVALALSAIPSTAADRELERALASHVSVLASDAFGGREPGTAGEIKTIRYIAEAWYAAGLASGTNDPGNPWFAPVELVERTPEASSAAFRSGGRRLAIRQDSVLVLTSAQRGLVENAPLLFVGHGYPMPPQGLLAGKVAVLLDARAGAGTTDRQGALLQGGAAAVLTVLDGERTLDELSSRRRRARTALTSDEAGGDLEAYISAPAARGLLAAGGADLAALSHAAASPNFTPRLLGIAATLEATSRETAILTHNVIGRLPGRRPGSGAVVFMAHWDHFGRCAEPPAEDLICNGAVDNASGVAMLIEVARRLASGKRPDRDIYFLATTAEESGLLGARALVEEPPMPREAIVAVFNIDSDALVPAGQPLAIVGRGRTGLEGDIRRVARNSKRRVVASEFADSLVERQDGWAFLQRGVPAVMIGASYANQARMEAFFDDRYHRPNDEAAPGLELGGAAEDVLFHVALGRWFGDLQRYRARGR